MKIFSNLKTAITFCQKKKKSLNYFVILLIISFFIETLNIGLLFSLSIFINPLEFSNKFPFFNEILTNNF